MEKKILRARYITYALNTIMRKNFITTSFIFNLLALARFSHAKKYLFQKAFRNRDPYKDYVLAKDQERSLCIWALQQIKHRHTHFSEDLYFWKLNGETWLGNLDHIHGLYEYLHGYFSLFYSCDCRNKTVLDIGGYIGDSARYFLQQGAKKVIIYEPLENNILCMRHNLKEAEAKVQIIPKAISQDDGEICLCSNYPAGHIGFGNQEGRYQVNVKSESFETLLSYTKADIAKIDCEGNEKYLLNLNNSALSCIPYWMIEIHDHWLIEKITQKFLASGFESIPVPVPEGHQGIFHFQLSHQSGLFF